MRREKLNILIAGPAGAGIEKSGKLLTLSMVRAGYRVFANVEHMSQIRGGHNFLRIRVDEEYKECHSDGCDILIALDRTSILEHLDEMREGSAIIYDGETMDLGEDFDSKGVLMVNVPVKKLAMEELKNPVMANVISLGVFFGLIGFELSGFVAILDKVFGHKSAEIRQANAKAAKIGYDLALTGWAEKFQIKVEHGETKNEMFLMGNDALAMGAVKAGVKFIGEYPMTPSSSILHFMAAWAEKYGIVVKHVEDEIAAGNSIIGAGFAGVRAMAATSGGGFALMTEAIGLAGMNEVPCVYVNVMRPGPATGLPTRTGQGDLRQVIHGGQDDPIKIVLCPGDIQECFRMGFEAFNLAEKYHVPVIITYDKYLGEGYFTVPPFEEDGLVVDRGATLTQEQLDQIEDFRRYLRTENGVSPRSIPGMKGGTYRATSDEHNEYGEICEDAENRNLMTEKRMKKLEMALAEMPGPELFGPEDATATLVTWNSSKLQCLEAMKIVNENGGSVNVVQIKSAYPFHKKEVSELLKKAKRLIAVEQNYTAQMAGLIAENTGILIEEQILRYDGRPMIPEDILKSLN